jgi:DNA-binding NtrC family response regulator
MDGGRLSRILFIDGDMRFLELYARKFPGALTSTTIARGLVLAVSNNPSAIVLDLFVQDYITLPTIPLLRAVAPHAPVIVVTAHSSAQTVARSLEAGAFAHLDKSDLHALTGVLTVALTLKDDATPH